MFVVTQLIIAPSYISDCYSSVVSTSRLLIQAFVFLFLYTWSLVVSPRKKKTNLPFCCATVEALLHAAITPTRPSVSIFISSHAAHCSVVCFSVRGRILSLFQNSDSCEGQNRKIGLFVLKIRNPNKGAEVLECCYTSL